MKNFILIFLIISLFGSAKAQNRKYSIFNNTNRIEDSVSAVLPDKYYLIPIKEHKELALSASRIVNDELIIVKGNLINLVNVNEKFYQLNNSWKFSANFFQKNRDVNKPHIFSLKYTPPLAIETIINVPGVELVEHYEKAHLLLVRTTVNILEASLANFGSIEYIDWADRVATEESPLRQYNPSINRITTAKNNYPNLTGDVTVSLKENSINDGDIDLVGKVTLDAGSSTEFTQHAKEMGTFIAGYGNSFMTGEGVATGASLICTNFNSLFAEDEGYYVDHSIHVQNHSYGTGIENFYGNETLSYDQIVVDMPELVHVFSAGNAGSAALEFGTYQGLEGYANLTGDFKQAKNVLVIAALDSAMNHESLTSSGPSYDGRVKPELAAFGGEGTSESAALASGSIAMLQDHFFQLNGYYPTSSLIKSLLIAGANEADAPGIDYRTGYGSINLNQSLAIIDSAFFYEGTMSSNESSITTITIPPSTAELKVVISWIDPPANPEDAFALVNDLDLTVTSPSNAVWLPWVLDPSPNISALSAPPIRGEDHLNNVEMISIENPESGNYTFTIKANTFLNNQRFSVAYRYKKKDTISWSYPTKSDHLTSATAPYLRWENGYDAQTATILIKYGEAEWEPIGIANTKEEQFQLTLKDTSSYAQLKMEVGPSTYLSDTFTISRLLELHVENDCPDELILSWDKLDHTNSYTLYGLQDHEMNPVINTSDTTLALNKSMFSEIYFAVQPTHTPHFDGLRSFAVNYTNQNKGCYLTNFLVNITNENLTTLELSVNVPYQIEEIVIYKSYQNEPRTSLEQLVPDSRTVYGFLDYNLKPGKHTYQAELFLKNGSSVLSEEITLFYTNENITIVFPNPVSGNTINVLNDFSGGTLQLLNSTGQFIKSYDLVNTVEPLDLTGVEPGMYLYRIVFENNEVATGRFIRTN